MPELPEVEMIVRHLRDLLTGRSFVRAQLLRPGLAPEVTPRSFAIRLKGARIVNIARRGKNILTRFDNGRTLVTHLRMSGRFLLVDERAHLARHTHAIFWLDDRKKLLFTDQRHFGWMTIVETEAEQEARGLRKLGSEPLESDFTPDLLHHTLRRSNRAIKLLLLDQTKIAGLGNIYVAEALFRAGIAPHAPARTISHIKASRLREAIVDVLTEAIVKIGGELESHWQVYDREGEPCMACRTPIRRTRQGQRSTYYCPRCQRR